MDNNSEVSMTHSGVLHDKEGKAFVCVRFERKNEKGSIDEAEMRVPGGKVLKNAGFTEDEVSQIVAYLKENEEEIKKKAKEISSILHIFS